MILFVSVMIKKILVPVDGSPSSLRGVKFAFSIGRPLESTIVAFQVLPNLFSYGIPKSNQLQKKSRVLAEKNLGKLEKIANEYGVKFAKKIQVNSNIGKSIIDFSNESNCDMIVIGSKGPDPAFEIFLGSVANYVVHKSKIPVVVVK